MRTASRTRTRSPQATISTSASRTRSTTSPARSASHRHHPPPPRRRRRRRVPGGGTNFGSGVVAQQQKLNELFAGKGIAELTTDGDSGSYTQQQLCAARLALGMPVNRNDMTPGGSEEQALMAAGNLPIPEGAPTSASRWALIDRTCQVMFVGEGSNGVTFVFGTSTGEAGHETRLQDESQVFRYDPARKNGGWHDSTSYPVAADNPLNGNMYKPLYFDNGQAIHGAGYVPTDPQSKGCVRLRVEHQDVLVGWLGLSDAPSPVWSTGDINLAVSVVGAY
ncbi:MAG: L,D-transpeptidase [Ilumatobacteraceae bacterium]